MKDYDKEIENIFLDEEEDVLQRIRIVYQNALKDVQAYAKSLQKELDELLKKVDPNDEIGLTKIRSKVYQLEYQKKLAQQINNYLDVIKDKDVNNITDYINKVYSNGFLTEQYRLMRSGIDITMPINQKLLKKAVTFNIDDIPLSTRLYTNVDKAKKEIINEISRGLSIGMSVPDMARNLQNTMGVSMRKAYQIAQNEGARVRQSAIIDSMREAKKKGADIVKQWSATLDGKTRPVHQELDGEWAEIEDDFKYSGGKVFAPKQFGIPSEDINCRCTLLSVPRWDIEDKHWQLDNERKELVKVKNYKDWYEKYYDVVVQAGAEKYTYGALDAYSKRAIKHAHSYYEQVRHMTNDTAKIAKNTGYKKELIDEIKNYVFFDEHDLYEGKSRFFPSYDMAVSWQRLVDGKSIKEQDLLLLEHEYFELSLIKQGYSQDEAHNLTNLVYNYTEAVQKGGK